MIWTNYTVESLKGSC